MMFSLTCDEDPIRKKLYRSMTHRPTDDERKDGANELRAKLKSFKYEAVYPDGHKETLLDVPHYDFNWQTTYRLKEMLPFPKGTTRRAPCAGSSTRSRPGTTS